MIFVRVKRINSFKLLGRVPGTIYCYLRSEGVYFHTNILIPDTEESVPAVISWAVASFIIILKSRILLRLLF